MPTPCEHQPEASYLQLRDALIEMLISCSMQKVLVIHWMAGRHPLQNQGPLTGAQIQKLMEFTKPFYSRYYNPERQWVLLTREDWDNAVWEQAVQMTRRDKQKFIRVAEIQKEFQAWDDKWQLSTMLGEPESDAAMDSAMQQIMEDTM